MVVRRWYSTTLLLLNMGLVSFQVSALPFLNTPHTNMTWHGEDINGLIAGNLAAGYSKVEHQSGSFELTSFNPLFIFSYRDLAFLEGSLNFSIDDMGESSAELDTANLNIFINDYAVFGIGKFDTDIGYFIQNLSPNWINKLPTVPAGFDDSEAAPQSEIGIRLRGAFCLMNRLKMNYALFVANGPIAFADDNGIIQFINADGVSTNDRGDYQAGGRIGILPIPKLEIGFSADFGNTAVFDLNSNLLSKRQDYDALGADFSYKWHDLDLRAEIVRQEVSLDEDDNPNHILTEGGKWTAWYGQIAYRIPATGWEPVIRYSHLQTPIPSENQKQWAFGIDYWFAPSLVAKLAYEINDGLEGSSTDSNVILAQMAFGF